MSKKTRETKKKDTASRNIVKVKRKINDDVDYYYYQDKETGEVTYPLPQLQKLYDYSKEKQFMFLQDWILALLYVIKDYPIVGITSFEKMLFLVVMEFAQSFKISSENPGFKGYYFGPYSERVEDVIIALEDANLIKTEGRKGSSGEYFILTVPGKEIAKKSYDKLTESQKMEFEKNRLKWHQWGTIGLERYIYRKYPEYIKESIIVDRVLNRRRVYNRSKKQLQKKSEKDDD